jgi:hypothetical protein
MFSVKVRVPTEDFDEEWDVDVFRYPALPGDPEFFGVC